MELIVDEQGLNVTITTYCPDDNVGLYKVYLKGKEPFLLGTLVPENKVLKLTRTLSKSQLKDGGVYPISGVEKVLVFPFQREEVPKGWRWVDGSELALLKGRGSGRFLYQETKDMVNIAWKYESEKENNFTDFFCFLRLEIWGNTSFFVLSFKK